MSSGKIIGLRGPSIPWPSSFGQHWDCATNRFRRNRAACEDTNRRSQWICDDVRFWEKYRPKYTPWMKGFATFYVWCWKIPHSRLSFWKRFSGALFSSFDISQHRILSIRIEHFCMPRSKICRDWNTSDSWLLSLQIWDRFERGGSRTIEHGLQIYSSPRQWYSIDFEAKIVGLGVSFADLWCPLFALWLIASKLMDDKFTSCDYWYRYRYLLLVLSFHFVFTI